MSDRALVSNGKLQEIGKAPCLVESKRGCWHAVFLHLTREGISLRGSNIPGLIFDAFIHALVVPTGACCISIGECLGAEKV